MTDASPVASGDPRALELLARIDAFGFNAPDDPLGFEGRLADDNGWTLGYAIAVTQEYRRFLVLTQVAGRSVSPSPDVDEAWHLHLTRTTHYKAFCEGVFGRFLHHEPARSGEGERHRDMYRETLAAYRQAFGVEAPSTTWPRPGRPMEGLAAPRWAIPPMLQPGHRLAAAAVLGAIAAALLLRGLGLLDPLQAIGPFAFLGLALLATVALARLGLRSDGVSSRLARDRLDPWEVAWLRGGATRMAMTAIVTLTERGVLLPPGPAPERGPRPPIAVNRSVETRCAHPAEAACLDAASDEGLRYTAACNAMRPLADQFERRLIAAGMATDAATLPLRRARSLLGLVLLLAVEFERIFHAFGTRSRIGFLVLLALAGVALAVVLAQRLRRANPHAARAMASLRPATAPSATAPRVGPALAFGVALAGTAAFAGDLRFDGLRQQIHVPSLAGAGRRAGQDGSPSGCSSSSCGSDGGSSGDGGGGSSCGSSCGSGCGGGGD